MTDKMSTSKKEHKINISDESSNIQGIVATGDVTISDSNITLIQRIRNTFFGDDEKRRQRHRQTLLKQVENYWTTSTLNKALHKTAYIELDMKEQAGVVEHPQKMLLQTSSRIDRLLPSGTKITDIFDKVGQSLLIMGEPGAGKTTLLSKLGHHITQRVEQNSELPIPVEFKLAFWADKRLPLDEWLVTELVTKYDIRPKVAQFLVDEDQLLLLLDGLDDVPLEHRASCVKAINEFRYMPLVVCSRRSEYEALNIRLKLRGAITLQPLTDTQITTYLDRVGTDLLAVRRTLQHDMALQELARSPLMLNIMSLAYQGKSVQELGEFMSVESRRTHLLNTYIDQMFERVGHLKSSRYTRDETMSWLTWLAQKMKCHNQPQFFIDLIQPDWLETKYQKRSYIWASRLTIGQISGLPLGLFFGLLTGITHNQVFFTNFWQADLSQFVGIVLWIIAGLIFGQGIGLIFSLIMDQRLGTGVRGVEVVRWSWDSMKQNIIIRLILGLGFGVVIASLFVAIGILVDDLDSSIFFGLCSGVTLALTFTLVTGWHEVKTDRNFANHTWVRNAAIVGGVANVAGTVIGPIIFDLAIISYVTLGAGLAATLNMTSAEFVLLIFLLFLGLLFGLFSGWVTGIFVALIVGLYTGGIALIKHLTLRIFLSYNGYLPWKLTRFLDYATDCIFLRKIRRGGYEFLHPLFLEHFAALKKQDNLTS